MYIKLMHRNAENQHQARTGLRALRRELGLHIVYDIAKSLDPWSIQVGWILITTTELQF
ncbi:MAG: hypothetical protein HY929_02775 [Euryarchaeota archaeon]|nr:hypothetical protein [Euryarchaeota archaeon]